MLAAIRTGSVRFGRPSSATAATVADPTLLTEQIGAGGDYPDFTAMTALNVDTAAAGTNYADPVTGRTVWKLTSSTVPATNTAGFRHDYGDSGLQITYPWGVGGDMYTVYYRNSDSQTAYFADYQLGVGPSNNRTLVSGIRPFSDIYFTFSNVAATPTICYSRLSTGNLIRADSATNATANIGNFPYTGFSNAIGTWLQTDHQDDWFISQDGSGDVQRAWRSSDGTEVTRSFTNLDEAHISLDGQFALVIHNGGQTIWDFEADTISAFIANGTQQFAHCGSLRDRWVSVNPNVSAPYRMNEVFANVSTPAAAYFTAGSVAENSCGPFFHCTGHWYQPTADDQQWALASAYNWGSGVPEFDTSTTPPHIHDDIHFQNGIGFIRADGSSFRLLCHQYTNYTAGDYFELPRATVSPDGKLVMFSSDPEDTGRHDVYVVEVPTS